MRKGMHGKGKAMSGAGMGAVGFRCKKQPKEIEHCYRKCKNIVKGQAATPSLPPNIMYRKIHAKTWSPHHQVCTLKENRCPPRKIIVQKSWQNV